MSSIIFFRSRYEYGSYSDLHRLIELSGYPLVFIDQLDAQTDNLYLLTVRNGELPENGYPDAKATIWHYNLEWSVYPPLAGITRTFSADKWFAANNGMDYLPIGSHADLALSPAVNGSRADTDVAMLAYMTGRREQVAYDMRLRGLRLAGNMWNPERDAMLRSTRAIVNVHQLDNVPALAAQRAALAAAYKLPFITETLADSGILDHTTILQSDYGNLADFVHMWTCRNDAHMLQEYGERLHYKLCVAGSFRAFVDAAL